MAATCWFGIISVVVFCVIAAAKRGRSLFD